VRQRWQKLSRSDRIRVLFVALFLLIGGYGLVLFPAADAQFKGSQADLSRRMDRLAKRTVITVQEVSTNPRVLQKSIEKIDRELVFLKAEIKQLSSGFATATSSDERQRLILEIFTLAAKSGVVLDTISGKSTSLSSKRTSAVVDSYWKRPLFKLSASAGYFELLKFLDGLKGLSKYVAVMNIDLQIRQREAVNNKKNAAKPQGPLQVLMTLAI
jgi:cell division protein FtsB